MCKKKRGCIVQLYLLTHAVPTSILGALRQFLRNLTDKSNLNDSTTVSLFPLPILFAYTSNWKSFKAGWKNEHPRLL